jgi:hypothetical protein
MSAPFVPALDTFAGGQMTDLPLYTGGVDLTALFEIVSPGNPNTAVNYAITAPQLALFLSGVIYASPTFVAWGASYPSVATDTRILVRGTTTSTTSVVMLGSASYSLPVLVKDLSGIASGANPINITFSGGQLFDGLVSISITNPYGYIWLNPLASGGWYDAAY